MNHSVIPQTHRCDRRLAGGWALLALAAGCLFVPSRSLLWWVAIPLALGAGALLPATRPRSRWVAAVCCGLALWIAYALVRTPMTQLDVSLSFLALAVVWVSWRLAGLRSTECAGLILGSLALLSLGGAAARIYAGSTASLSHMELWRAEDQGLVTPLLWPELAVGLSAMALPLLLAEARSAPCRAARIAARALCLPLVAGMALVAGGLGWLCAALGILWACARGRWLRWPIWVGVAVVAVGAGAYAVHKLPDRDDAVRNRAVVSLQAIVDARIYAWSSALYPLGAEPLGSLLAPHGPGPRMANRSPVLRVALSGTERTRSPSDAVLTDCGTAGWARVPRACWSRARARTRQPRDRRASRRSGRVVARTRCSRDTWRHPSTRRFCSPSFLRLLDGPSEDERRVTCPALHHLTAAGVAAVLVVYLAPTNEESIEVTPRPTNWPQKFRRWCARHAYADAARLLRARVGRRCTRLWSHRGSAHGRPLMTTPPFAPITRAS